MDNLKRTDRTAAAVGDTVGALGTGKTLDSIIVLVRTLSSETAMQKSIRNLCGSQRALKGVGFIGAHRPTIVLKLTAFDPIVHVAETLSPADCRRWHRAGAGRRRLAAQTWARLKNL